MKVLNTQQNSISLEQTIIYDETMCQSHQRSNLCFKSEGAFYMYKSKILVIPTSVHGLLCLTK